MLSRLRAGWLVLPLLAGCEREAPGPLECRKFALSAVGVSRSEELEQPRIKQKIEEVTHECLTEPYDRELLHCFEQTGEGRACKREFTIRRRSKPDR